VEPIRRGEIYFVELGPVRGREIDEKRRPVLVLSINDLNSKPLVITVVPGTKAANKPVHFRNAVVVPATVTNGLAFETIFECHQLKALDHSRFTSPAVGALAEQHLVLVEDAVRYSLGLLPNMRTPARLVR
jgi:mRNA-degrading endonuclease toxin of MazEF toxin-antitoxin module